VLAFNRDTCCHLAICLQLIVSHYGPSKFYDTGPRKGKKVKQEIRLPNVKQRN
jgi:hypothetical protein